MKWCNNCEMYTIFGAKFAILRCHLCRYIFTREIYFLIKIRLEMHQWKMLLHPNARQRTKWARNGPSIRSFAGHYFGSFIVPAIVIILNDVPFLRFAKANVLKGREEKTSVEMPWKCWNRIRLGFKWHYVVASIGFRKMLFILPFSSLFGEDNKMHHRIFGLNQPFLFFSPPGSTHTHLHLAQLTDSCTQIVWWDFYWESSS